jgi:hypothetical protein
MAQHELLKFCENKYRPGLWAAKDTGNSQIPGIRLFAFGKELLP